MFRKESRKQQSQIGSLIGVGTRIVGNVRFTGGLRVDGAINGNVSTAGALESILVVGEQGRIEGELTVSRSVINGTVIGSTVASESLELQSGARITGDVYYNAMEMHRGAVVQGQMVCRGERTHIAEPAAAAGSAKAKVAEPERATAARSGDR